MNKQQSNITVYNTGLARPHRLVRRWAALLTISLVSVLPLGAGAATSPKNNYTFVNAVDSTQGFLLFGFAPSINNTGAVAFEALGPGFLLGSGWKWQAGTLTP